MDRRREAHKASPDKKRGWVSRWRKNNPEKVRAMHRRYYHAHRLEILAANKEHRKQNQEKIRNRNAHLKRKAGKTESAANH